MQKTLAFLAVATLRRNRPIVIGVTGSVGKTSTKEAIYAVLSSKFEVRRSEKNYNTEIGVPLAILGIPYHGWNVFRWGSAFIRAAIRVLIRDQNFPEILVLEMAADRPGDIGYLVNLAPPRIGVFTAIGEIPVHVEFFASPRAVAEEKSKLIQALMSDGYAVLNHDDAAVMETRNLTRARMISYGFGSGAGVRIKDYRLVAPGSDEPGRIPGIAFSLEYDGSSVGVKLSGAFGKQQAYAASAAAAVGLALNLDLDEIALALAHYKSPPGRLKLLRGNKNTIILDDSYNSSPASTMAALEVLEQFPAKRRIAVLGDMLELGAYTEEAHQMVGAVSARAADLLFAVGDRMKFAFNAATAPKPGDRRLSKDHCFWFASAVEAGPKLDSLLEAGDVVLIKGSQGMRMEKAIKEVMAEPERASELLVRQDKAWLGR